MKRIAVPTDVAAKALFYSDRTCCVCRVKGKPVQIHHIDDNKSNNDINNLAILCFECHNNTQISGGFNRKLSEEQIILYRDDWLSSVARKRTKEFFYDKKQSSPQDIELITTELEILRERKQYELLAIHYNIIGNTELRDKYIDMALKQNTSDENEIFLRALQSKIELVNKKKIKNEIDQKIKDKDWSELARLYIDIKDWNNAIQYYFKTICESLQEGSTFAAAYYLKELTENELHKPLFERAYREFSKQKNLWWQVRTLQELKWDTELKSLLISHRKEIEKSGDLLLLRFLYEITGEKEKLLEVNKKFASSIKMQKY
jgi:hypothetical protein